MVSIGFLTAGTHQIVALDQTKLFDGFHKFYNFQGVLHRFFRKLSPAEPGLNLFNGHFCR